MAMKNGLFAAERGLFDAVRGLRRTRFGAVRRGVCAALLALGALGAWGDDGVTSVEVAAGETLVGRPTPEDVARAVAYLLDAKSTTGAILPVDGGQHLLDQ